MPSTNLYALQLDIAWEDKAANYRKVESLLQATPPNPGSLVVLPEMFSTGFSMNLGITQQGPGREDEAFLAGLARKHRICVAGGLVNPGSDGKGRNDAVAFSPEGTVLAHYTKIHPFSLGGEANCHERGSEIVTFPWAGFVAAPFVCYDLRFPEIFRAAVRRGANLFTVIANWPDTRIEHWITLLRARAIENQAYVVGVNRVGSDPTLKYPGRSLLVDPMGQIVLDAGEGEGVFGADVSIDAVRTTRERLPFLRDMRDP